MKVAEDKTEARLLRIIQSEIPNLEVRTSKLVVDSWDNTVIEVNEEYIFRFPKDEDNPFETEVKVLQYLQGKISVEIPNIQFVGKDHKYMGYKKILGRIMPEEEMIELAATIKERIAEGAAKFLFELHDALSIETAREMGVKEIRMSTFADQILPTIPHHFPEDLSLVAFAEAAVAKYQRMKEEDYPKRVLHWDLHNDNMVLNDDFSLKGVIDFGDVEVGDVHVDFHPLYKFDTGIAEMTLAAYTKKSGLNLSLERVKVYSWINELSDVAELVNDPTNPAYQKSMGRIQKWINESL